MDTGLGWEVVHSLQVSGDVPPPPYPHQPPAGVGGGGSTAVWGGGKLTCGDRYPKVHFGSLDQYGPVDAEFVDVVKVGLCRAKCSAKRLSKSQSLRPDCCVGIVCV